MVDKFTCLCVCVCEREVSALFNIDHEIKREDDRIHKVFQDPTGQHVIVCMESKECHYFRRTAKKTQPRVLPKVRGQLIESVAWNKVDQTETATGPILLGTNSGGIYETDIVFEESLLKQRKGYFQEVRGNVAHNHCLLCLSLCV